MGQGCRGGPSTLSRPVLWAPHFLPGPGVRRQHREYLFQGFHGGWRFIRQSTRKGTALLWESPNQKTSARKHFRQGQLIPAPLLQYYKPPLVLVLLQPGKKGWSGTGGTLLPLALLCPDSTWGFPQHILWHCHCSGHGHNIHLSHLQQEITCFSVCSLYTPWVV